ncbi:hypothetical protein [Scytonema sp. PRP1]|uniref:hypothetical protein n=1 Tax=Scytonema sp. PRP1 TaxID=3120513 RepID=UPI002FD3253C
MANNSIGIGGNFDGNMIAGSSVQGNVSASIKKQSGSHNPEKLGIQELLTQLKEAIEAEPTLDEKNKVKALRQVEALKKAGEKSKDSDIKEQAEDAITMLKGIFSGLTTGASLLLEWHKLLPELSNLFSIG